MCLITTLTLLILDAVDKLEGWIESAVVDNEDSPFLTVAGLAMALLLGLWKRCVVPRFRLETGDDSEAGQGGRSKGRKKARGSRCSIECRFDIQGRWIETPDLAVKLTGFKRESMIGSLFSRFLLETDIAAVIEGFLQVMRGEDVHDLRIRLRRADGALVPAEMDLYPVVRSGEISGVRGMLKPLAEFPPRERRVDDRPGACVYVFRRGKMLFVNPLFAQSIGYDRREIASVDPMQIIHPADRLRVRQSNIGHLKGNPSSSCDFRIVTREGRVKWVRARVRSVMYRGEKAVLGNFVVMPAKENLPLHSSGCKGESTASPSFGCSSRLCAGNG